MQRIPNPVSDPTVFIRVFGDIYRVLHQLQSFGLDDMTKAMILTNSVTSQGAIGKEALRRSTRPDRSRDPLYNQAKMYAELFRTLGWIQSGASRLRYSVTILGDHIAAAGDPTALMRECLLGIAYPNEVLGVHTDQTIRVVGTILLTLDSLTDLSRDEMIAGPMSIASDSDPGQVEAMLQRIRRARKKPGALDKWLDDIAKARGIARHPTMENYTRFPLGVLAWSDWSTKKRGVLTITDSGREAAKRLREGIDLRLKGFYAIDDDLKAHYVRWCHYRILERSGFNLSPVADMVRTAREAITPVLRTTTKDIYFSPFQQLSREHILEWAPELVPTRGSTAGDAAELVAAAISGGGSGAIQRRRSSIVLQLSARAGAAAQKESPLLAEIGSALQTMGSVQDAVAVLLAAYSQANRDVFYPLVTNLFSLLGYDCHLSRAGQNYERADALIRDRKRSIPIEIKSPGEETEISVKAVRQALENKIVLLSRRNYPTEVATTTLVVGFNAPNDRSEVHELVEDIRAVYGIRIGIIDLRSLFVMAALTVRLSKQVRPARLHDLQGVVNAPDPASVR